MSCMLILYFDFIPCCFPEVAHRVMIGYNLRYSKVIEKSIKDSPLLIEVEYTHGLLLGLLFRISGFSRNIMKSVFNGMTNDS